MPSSFFQTLFSIVGVIAAVSIVGCGSKPQQTAKDKVALLPPDSSVMQLPATEEKSTPQQQDVLPSQDESVAALIRKSEAYARELNQVRDTAPKPPEQLPVMPQQITVKPPDPQQFSQEQQNSSTTSTDTSKPSPPAGTVVADANMAVPMTANHANIANEPVVAKLTAPAPAAPSVSSDVLEKKLLSRVKDYPRDVAGHLEYQMMLFLKDQQTPDMASLSVLPDEDRELVAAVMDGVTNFRNQLRSDNNMLLSKKIRPMVDLATRLQSQAELSVPSMALCTRVEGFGRYDPIEPPRFIASRETQVIVYCEVANFTSRITGDKNMWQTDLTQEIVLYHDSGQSVWSDQPSKIQDVSRVRRHDFFVRKLVALPSTLPVGRYLMKVTVTDQQANRVAESSLPLEIVAK